jgi:signal transduction histidine kinase/CheY-like chemotaxis protein
MDAEQQVQHNLHMQRYLASGEASLMGQPRLLQGLRRDGSLFPVRLTVSDTRVDNEHYFIALIQDYTSVQQAQDQLVEARDKAEQANRLRGEFLANMSHEIRTPMNGIVGMTEQALKTRDEQARKEYLTLAQDSAHHLLHIINEILDFSKIEARALELELQPINAAQLMTHTARTLEPLAHARGLAFGVDINPALDALVWLDPVRVRQVLTNLIGNAIKFTERGEVQVHAVVEAAQDGGGLVRITITDTGIGFDPARTEALFSPFTQADGSVTRSFGGTGLGLAITRSLLQLMGGDVTAQGRPGQGASFVARLPWRPVLAQPSNPSVAVASPGCAITQASGAVPERRSLLVLLVEDHAINRKLAEIQLQQMGHRFVSAGDGLEALERLQEQRFDVVLMDVMMPRLDGVSALRALREREAGQTRQTPVLMVTAHAMTGDRERFLAAGADGYVSKPLSQEALCREIARVTGVAQGMPKN